MRMAFGWSAVTGSDSACSEAKISLTNECSSSSRSSPENSWAVSADGDGLSAACAGAGAPVWTGHSGAVLTLSGRTSANGPVPESSADSVD